MSVLWFQLRGLSFPILFYMTLEEFFTYDEILFRLCKARAKLARQRGKSHLNHIISSDSNLNYHDNNEKSNRHKSADITLLCSMMPSRRKWISPHKKERYINNGIQRINSLEFNVKSILRTINYYKRHFPTAPFLLELDKFINSIIHEINNPDYKILNPDILPKLKDPNKKNDKTCRPICIYNLKDKIIISIINKYLTKAFDPFFYEHSYAFRTKKEEAKMPPTHHDAINHLLSYKSKYKGKRLWVSECDISKFFDTVNHTIVKSQFSKLVNISNKQQDFSIDNRAILIFLKYLKSFDFQKDIFKKNGKLSYWESKRILGGKFGWVKTELEKLGCYRQVSKNKIGIPQGGALSGLIANIVLHYADSQILKAKDEKLCYVRFCDDMIIIHPQKTKATEYTNIYIESLKNLKLVSHLPQKINYSQKKSFWNDSKSKATYKWSNDRTNGMNRIGFVGYEICFNCTLRVRKSSLIKEKQKIKKMVKDTLHNLRKGKRKSDNMIRESISNKLIGMSVGRVSMKNYKEVDNDMCWVNGFASLNSNDNLKLQLRRLDRYRAKYLSRFKKKLKRIPHIPSNNGKGSRYIGKYFFCKIWGINNKDSLAIRQELINTEVLSPKFSISISKREKIKTGNLSLSLSSAYSPFEIEIIECLLNEDPEDRDVPIYGKPFSYFYNVIEKKTTT